jgi:hypothetical protein
MPFAKGMVVADANYPQTLLNNYPNELELVQIVEQDVIAKPAIVDPKQKAVGVAVEPQKRKYVRQSKEIPNEQSSG